MEIQEAIGQGCGGVRRLEEKPESGGVSKIENYPYREMGSTGRRK